MPSITTRLSGLVRQDVRVTGINDGHGGAVRTVSMGSSGMSWPLGAYHLPTEELSKGGAKLDLQVSLVSLWTGTLQSLSRLLLWAGQKTWCLLTETHKNHSPNSSWDLGVKTYVVAVEVVDGRLGQHAVVLQLTFAERRGVAGDEDELKRGRSLAEAACESFSWSSYLGLAAAQRLERRLVTEHNLTRLHHKRELGVDGVGICLGPRRRKMSVVWFLQRLALLDEAKGSCRSVNEIERAILLLGGHCEGGVERSKRRAWLWSVSRAVVKSVENRKRSRNQLPTKSIKLSAAFAKL